MIIRIGLENNIEGRSLAWALDYPGAFAYGADGSEALLALPRGLIQYENWANQHAGQEWLRLGDFDLRLVETWQPNTIDPDFEDPAQGHQANAWFRDDWRPLTEDEVQRGLTLLEWSRADLLAITAELSAEKLDTAYPGERWSIRGILTHIAVAEWFFIDRFGQAPRRDELPRSAFERLDCRTPAPPRSPSATGRRQPGAGRGW